MDRLIERMKDLVGVKPWDYAERRKALRVPCRIEGTVQRGDQVMGAEIRSVGMGGLSLLVYGKLKKGQTVQVRCLKEHLQACQNTITCRVEWTRKEGSGVLVGVSFQEHKEILNRSWLVFELREAGVRAKNTKQKRENVRVNCLIPARMQNGKDNRKARIRDLASNGARVECPGAPFQEGEALVLRFGPIEHLPAIAVAARVVTIRDFGVMHYGLAFDQFEVGDKKALRKYISHFFHPAKPKS
jgi:hypothetical protein